MIYIHYDAMPLHIHDIDKRRIYRRQYITPVLPQSDIDETENAADDDGYAEYAII